MSLARLTRIDPSDRMAYALAAALAALVILLSRSDDAAPETTPPEPPAETAPLAP